MARMLSCASTALTACTRAFLTNATTRYVKARAAGNSAEMASLLLDSASYTENEHTVAIGMGVLSQPLAINYTRPSNVYQRGVIMSKPGIHGEVGYNDIKNFIE